MKRLSFVVLTLALGLVLVLGCTSTTDGDGDGNGGDTGTLGWALQIANGVQDTELPNAILICIASPDADENGKIPEGSNWFFGYYKDSAETNLWVFVFYDGSTYIEWDDPGSPIIADEIPGYTDAKTWIQTADDAVDELITIDKRAVTVGYDDDDLINIVIILYWQNQGDAQAAVTMDADTSEILDVEIIL